MRKHGAEGAVGVFNTFLQGGLDERLPQVLFPGQGAHVRVVKQPLRVGFCVAGAARNCGRPAPTMTIGSCRWLQ